MSCSRDVCCNFIGLYCKYPDCDKGKARREEMTDKRETESPADRAQLARGEIPAHIAMPAGFDCRVCGKPAPGEVVIFDKTGAFQRYYCTKCYDLLTRLRASAKEQEDEATSWDFDGRDGKYAAQPMLQLAALLREAADKLDRQ